MHVESESPDGGAKGGGATATGAAAEEALSTVSLSSKHDVSGFRCKRSKNVEEFLAKHAAKWVAARCSSVFILPSPENDSVIWGYYTLSASLIVPASVKPELAGGLPRVPIPMALIGFMGRHDDAPKGVGAGLIHDAALRLSRVRENLALWGIWLNAENEGDLMKWYEKVGFIRATPKKPGDTTKAMYAPLEALLVK